MKGGGEAGKRAARERRSAEALRANLKRRKAREREQVAAPGAAKDTGETGAGDQAEEVKS